MSEQKKQTKTAAVSRTNRVKANPYEQSRYSIREICAMMYRDNLPALARLLAKSIKQEDAYTALQIMREIGRKGVADQKAVDEQGSSDNKIEIIVTRQLGGEQEKASRKPYLSKEEQEEQNEIRNRITELTSGAEEDN